MSLMEYNKSIIYALRVYTRRDFYFVVSQIMKVFSKKHSVPQQVIDDDKNVDFQVDQKQIEEWIEQENDRLRQEGKWLGPM